MNFPQFNSLSQMSQPEMLSMTRPRGPFLMPHENQELYDNRVKVANRVFNVLNTTVIAGIAVEFGLEEILEVIETASVNISTIGLLASITSFVILTKLRRDKQLFEEENHIQTERSGLPRVATHYSSKRT